MERERREYSRVEVSWPVSVLTAQGIIDGEVRNISFGGACIKCQELPNPDEALDLNILIPEQDYSSVSANAEVVWSKTDDTNTSSPPSQLGIRFLDISDEDLRLISRTALV